MTRVLVAIDGTTQSLRAARLANKLFSAEDAEFLLINIARVPTQWTPAMYGEVVTVPLDAWLIDAERVESDHAADARAMARQAGLAEAEVLVDFGEPAERICEAGERHDVDVIVVGSQDKGFLRRLVDPSVADHVVHATSRPVLVVSGAPAG